MRTNVENKHKAIGYLYVICVLAGPIIANLSYADQKEGSISDVEKVLETTMGQCRNREIVAMTPGELVKTYGTKLLPYMAQYGRDSSEDVRYRYAAILWLMGTDRSTQKNERICIVDELTKRLADGSALVYQHVAKWLLDFKASDFSEETKKWLENEFYAYYAKTPNSNKFRDMILVCGVADIGKALPILKKLLEDERRYEKRDHAGRWYGTVSWAAHRACARMGVMGDIKWCIKLIDGEKDKIVKYAVLLGHLQYIRQPEAVEILNKYLQSKEGPLFNTKDAVLFPANYWAAEALGQMLEDFPIKKEVSLYNEDDIRLCRQWVSKQKKWSIIR